jgi:glycogen operon protein
MTDADWDAGFAKVLGVFLNGDGIPNRDRRGRRIVDDSLLLLFSAHHEPIDFTLPAEPFGTQWDAAFDTADPLLAEGARVHKAGEVVPVAARSVVVLRRPSSSS